METGALTRPAPTGLYARPEGSAAARRRCTMRTEARAARRKGRQRPLTFPPPPLETVQSQTCLGGGSR